MPRVLFTRETAAIMAARSNAVQRERRRELDAMPQESRSAMISRDYTSRRLTRVRGQLDRLDKLMGEETDPQRLDRLASAQYRVSEQERILAGRPLPGSWKPERPKQAPRVRAEPIALPQATIRPNPVP